MTDRYIRHSILPEIGELGQQQLLKSKVGVLGAGGLGSPVLQYLAAVGIGNILVIDNDVVEEVNLNRQIIHSTDKIGVPKAQSAAEAMKKINPTIIINYKVIRLDEINGEELFKGCDVLVDCCDNHQSRYALSDVGVKLNIPVVTGSVVRWEGHVTVLNYKGGPCYRCLYPRMPATSLNATAKSVGVVGMICGIIGSIQAMETIKILLGSDDVLSGKMFMYNGMTLMHKVMLTKPKKKDCISCSENI
ncbi:putative molybdopterin-synthase adenylyltransferase [Entamoeba marina]